MKRYKKLDFKTEDLESLSNSDLKKIADYELRQYLLGKQKNGIYYYCPLKKKNYPLTQMQVAHYIDRGIMNTRYDLTNCHLVSKQSNEWDAQVQKEGYKSLHHFDYEVFLKNSYGENIIDILKSKSKELKIFYKKDYINIINEFRNYK
jgi:hypothetical protein